MISCRKTALFIAAFTFSCISPVFSVSPKNNTDNNVDLIISSGTIITVDPEMRIIDAGSIAIKDGKIIAIGKKDDIEKTYTTKEIISADGKVVMPGLVNTHTHSAMILFRGHADDMLLKDWLEKHIWPAEANYINAAAVRAGTRLAIAEMIRSGSTCFNDMYFFEDEVAQTAKEANMRAVIGEGLLDYPTPNCKTPAESIKYTETLLKKYKNDPLITVSVAPHSPYTCSTGTLLMARKFADKNKTLIHTHLSETQDEIKQIEEKYGMRPPAFLDSLLLLSTRTIAVHCASMNEDEVKLLSGRNVGVAHCPRSNMKLAEEASPVTLFLDNQMKVGLGSDGAASNNSLNIFKEMYMASLLQKVTYGDPTVVNSTSALRMATIDGARVLGLGDKIGSLEKGKYADIIILDLNGPETTPSYNVYSTLLYACDGSEVETVIIGGKVVMQDRKLMTIDLDKAIKEVNELVSKIRK